MLNQQEAESSHCQTHVSRRSSLESMEELELQRINSDSRPGTAHGKKSHTSIASGNKPVVKPDRPASDHEAPVTYTGICEHPGCEQPVVKHYAKPEQTLTEQSRAGSDQARSEWSVPESNRSGRARSARQETPIEIPSSEALDYPRSEGQTSSHHVDGLLIHGQSDSDVYAGNYRKARGKKALKQKELISPRRSTVKKPSQQRSLSSII